MEKTVNTLSDFDIKQRKYMPVFPMATGKTTVYIKAIRMRAMTCLRSYDILNNV